MMNFKTKMLLFAIFIISVVSMSPLYANEVDNTDVSDIVDNNLETDDLKVVEEITNEQTKNEEKSIPNNSAVKESNEKKVQTSASASNINYISVTYGAFLSAARKVTAYADTYGKLPNYVDVAINGGTLRMSMPDFVYNAAYFIDYYRISGGSFNQLSAKFGFDNPAGAFGDSINGHISSSNYITYARNLINWMDANGQVPNYMTTSLGRMQFQSGVLTFATIINYIDVFDSFPTSVYVNRATNHPINQYLPIHSSIIIYNYNVNRNDENSNSANSVIVGKTAQTITSANNVRSTYISHGGILYAASQITAYVLAHGVLPNYVVIHERVVTIRMSMQDFVYSAAKLLKDYVETGEREVHLTKIGFGNPAGAFGDSINGHMSSSNYITYARNLINWMDANGQAPNYMTTSLGRMQFQSGVLTFASILNYFRLYETLPTSVYVNRATNHPINQYLPVYDTIISVGYGGASSINNNLVSESNSVNNVEESNDLVEVDLMFSNLFGTVNNQSSSDSCSTLTA